MPVIFIVPYADVDINECAVNNGGCLCDMALGSEHSCVASCANSPGSYECTCNEGYTLASDSHTCIGMYNTF